MEAARELGMWQGTAKQRGAGQTVMRVANPVSGGGRTEGRVTQYLRVGVINLCDD